MSEGKLVHPGRIIKKELKARDVTQKEFCESLQRPQKWLSAVVSGRKSITPESALDLENFFGIRAEYWMRLQTQYDVQEARLTYQKEIKPYSPPKPKERALRGVERYAKTIMKMHNLGASPKLIGAALDLKPNSVYCYIHRKGLKNEVDKE